MAERSKLHEVLVSVLGSTNVYYQPPESIRLNYPCIVYKRNLISSLFADNKKYKHMTRYQVTLIHKDPDNTIIYDILELPKTKYSTSFISNGLNHDVFDIYF